MTERSKKVNNAKDAFPTEMCMNAIRTATGKSNSWDEICNEVAQVALNASKPNVDRAFKVTCAVYKQDAYSYHSSYKKSLGGYYEFELKNDEREIFTFVYKRTMHSSEGIAIKSNEVLKRLGKFEPEFLVTLDSKESK